MLPLSPTLFQRPEMTGRESISGILSWGASDLESAMCIARLLDRILGNIRVDKAPI